MGVPCVRVRPAAGEDTRERLADADLLSDEFDITVEGGWLYLPVVEPAAVPDELEVVEFEADPRRTPTTPQDVLGFEPAYERLGDIVIVDEDDSERARTIADAIMASNVRAKTVVNRASKVRGEFRVRDWEVLAGDGTETVHREYGYEFALDIAAVYFSPRLATERHRVVERVAASEHVVDMFAGVGPFAIPMADRGAEVVGVDVNPVAIEYLRENAERNGVSDRVTAIEGDVREVAVDYENWADRLVMNLPHSANEFLDAAVLMAGDDCVIHYYDIQHEDDPFGPGVDAIQAAVGTAYDVSVERERVVRSYAPHEHNVVLDVRLTRR
jgi:tRNA (guanine37-N1)-methyltransferase